MGMTPAYLETELSIGPILTCLYHFTTVLIFQALAPKWPGTPWGNSPILAVDSFSQVHLTEDYSSSPFSLNFFRVSLKVPCLSTWST